MKRIRYPSKPLRTAWKRIRDELRLRTAFILLIVAVIAVIGLVVRYYAKTERDVILERGRYLLNTRIKHAIINSGFKEIRAESGPGNQLSLAFSYGGDRSMQSITDIVTIKLRQHEFGIIGTHALEDREGLIFFVDFQGRPVGTLTFLPAGTKGKIEIAEPRVSRRPMLVIIIDDFGYSNNGVVGGFLKLPAAITVSVIPGHQYSRWTASEAQKAGKEIMIHMPMESEIAEMNHGEDQFMLRIRHSNYEIEQRIQAAVMELPEAVGMNNHMGSLATADRLIMEKVMISLRNRGLYFIDSLTSPKSIAYEVARENGVAAAVRTVFLDNNRDKSEIQAQFEKVIRIAEKHRKAVAVGHVYPQTLEVLQYLLESGKLAGVELMFASQIVTG